MSANGAEPGQLPLLTRETAKQSKQRHEAGYIFPLPSTGGSARVRICSLQDRAVIGQLPAHLRAAMAEAAENMAGNREQRRQRSHMSEAELAAQFSDQIEHWQDVSDRLCLMGFIQPRLVRTEAELDDDPYCILLEDIHPEDRRDFANLCVAGEREAAVRLRPFREGSLDALSDQPSEQAGTAAVTADRTTPAGV